MEGLDKGALCPRYCLIYRTALYMLLFADDIAVIQANKNPLQKSLYDLQKISKEYHLKTSTAKTKVMAFCGKYLIRSNVMVNKIAHRRLATKLHSCKKASS